MAFTSVTTRKSSFLLSSSAVLVTQSGVCEPECPVDAIVSDAEEGAQEWVELNDKYSKIWPNINAVKDSPSNASDYENEKDKFNKYFSENIKS